MSSVTVFGQDPRFRGGGLTMLEAFWAAASELGREPRLAYVENPGLAGRPAEPPFDVPGVRTGPRYLDAGRQLRAAKTLAAEAGPYSWVVAALAPAGLPAARSGRPYAFWIATALEQEWAARRTGLAASRRIALGLNAPLLRRFEREVVRGATVPLALSASAARDLARAADVDPARIGVLPAPVALDRFRPALDDEWLAGLDEPLLVFVGRGNDPRKNVRLLLEALPLIRRHLPARLRLVGEPPDGELPEGVETVGETREVGRYLRDAHLFVLPSLQEGFGIVVAESLAAGVPVLSTPCAGPEEMLAESGGGRVLTGFEPEELAGAVVELLGDRDTLLQLRRRGREYVVREHGPERFRERVADAFGTLEEAARAQGYSAVDD